jgi:hypothetical protein
MKTTPSSLQPALDIWRDVFTAHRAALWSAANALLTCSCVDAVLDCAREEACAMDVPGAFRYGYALRAVVKTAIAHALECREQITGQASESADLPFAAPKSAHIKSLPMPERFVYFLVEILGYPRRDVSLLVGLSDANTDQMLSMARRRLKRVDHPARPPRFSHDSNLTQTFENARCA